MNDYPEIYAWALIALRSNETDMPYETLAAIIASCVRRLERAPSVIYAAGGYSALSPADKEAFEEACGYYVAARWIMLPRPDGEEEVVRLKIGQLEEVYRVPDLERLVEFYREESRIALSMVSLVSANAIADHLAGKGRIRIVIASPTRYEAGLTPSSAGVLSDLFSPRQLSLLPSLFDNTGGEFA